MEGDAVTDYKDILRFERKVHFYRNLPLAIGCCEDVGLYIASIKFEELEDHLTMARYTLIQGIRMDHALSEGQSTEANQNIVRFYHLRHAIIDYNACFDYILQIIYFGFNFFEPITTSKDYEDNMGKCRFEDGNKFRKRFEAFAQDNIKAKQLFDKLLELYKSGKESHEWANKLKHHGGLTIKEMQAQRIAWVNEHLASFMFRPTLVTLDEVIDKLTAYNNEICHFADELFEFIGFEKIEKPFEKKEIRPFVYKK